MNDYPPTSAEPDQQPPAPRDPEREYGHALISRLPDSALPELLETLLRIGEFWRWRATR